MKRVLIGAWRHYRDLPLWAQVVIILLTIGLIGSVAGGDPERQQVAASAPGPVEEQLPRASTTTTERLPPTTSTTAPVATTSAATQPPTTVVPPVVTTIEARADSLPPLTPSPTAATGESDTVPTGCHPSYTGACLPPDASDVDCAGGSGNGPVYATEKGFGVVGPDVFDLDRDGDGIACES